MPYRIHPKALEDLADERKAIIRRLGMHLITVDQAQRMAESALKRVLSQAYTDHGRDTFPIQCSGCGKIVVVADDVLRYTCSCSPNTERYTFQSRKLDLKIGSSGMDDYLSANVGRQTLTLSPE